MSGYYPIYLNIFGRTCVIVGGGVVAARKARPLIEAGAVVRVVSPEVGDAMANMIEAGEVEYIQERFEPEHLDNAALVIAATDDMSVNRYVYESARAENIPVNVVDIPELCTFIVPATVKRGDLTIAISTSGKSPSVAKRLRMTLEQQFGDEWAIYLETLGEAREHAMREVEDPKTREVIFNQLADSDLLKKIREGDMEAARRIVEEAFDRR